MFTDAKIKQLTIKCCCVGPQADSIPFYSFPFRGNTDRFFFDFPPGRLLILLVCVLVFLAWQHWHQNRIFAFSPGFFLLTGVFFLLLGTHLTTRSKARSNKKHFSHVYNPNDLVRVLLQKRISKNKERQRFQAVVLAFGSTPIEGKAFVTLEADSIENDYFFGDTLWTRNTLYSIRPPVNPGAFDFREYAARKNIFHQLYLKPGDFVLKRGKKAGLMSGAIELNSNLQRILETVLEEPRELSVAKALLLGDRNEIPVDLLNYFKGAGAMHILAISGLHVGIIHLILLFLTRPLILLRKGRTLRVILVLFGLWSYALLTGMAVSAIRAVSMFTLLTLGHALNRRTSLFHNLVNSAFILLIINPLFLFDVGFQLSYSALTGIAVGAFLIEKEKMRRKRVSKIQAYFLGLTLVSCSAQLGVMPLSLYYFNQFSGLFLVSSLLLLPVLGTTLVFGYSVLGASVFFNIPSFVQKSFQAWLELINNTIEWIGGIDRLISTGIYFPISFLILATAGLLLLLVGYLKRKAIFIFASGACLICMQLFWIHERVSLIRNEKLIVFHQRGESLVVRRKGSRFELMNCHGLSERGERNLKEYSAELPGDFVLHPEKVDTLKTAQLFYVQGSIVCILGEELKMDSMHVLDSISTQPDIVIFSNSPKVNLERLLAKIRPRIVVADGSNYKQFVERCKATCISLGLEFHATREKGAFLYPQ
jgi:competence protein ComEC